MEADAGIPLVGAAILGVAVIVALVVVARTRGLLVSKRGRPLGQLPGGVQFYANPTALEPPGTVFRIDPNRAQYLVKQLEVTVQSAPEASGAWRETVRASTGVLAQLLGVAPVALKAGSERTEEVAFELSGVVREVTFDSDLDAAVEMFRREKYRADNRYFIIRECWLAKSINYNFRERYILDLGGEAVLKQLTAKGALLSRSRSGEYVLKKKFETPMRVLFLPEEIKPISAALGRELPRLDRVQVTGPLVWESRQR
jgi:hypothetical protein